MRIKNFFLLMQKQINPMSGFMLALLVIAICNFTPILIEDMKAASNSGTYTSATGFQVTACYFGPPLVFFPRFIVLISLMIGLVGSFMRGFRGKIISFIGVIASSTAYLFWWFISYRTFKNLSSSEIDFLNIPAVKHTAYLYNGNLLDVFIAISLFVILILQAERLVKKKIELI